MPLILILGGLAVFALASGKSSAAPGGAPTPVSITAGKTYRVVMRAVGAKISDQEVSDNVKVLQALGSAVNDHSLNDSRDTLTLTIVAGRDNRLVVNQFYPNPANPQVGFMFTSITEVGPDK